MVGVLLSHHSFQPKPCRCAHAEPLCLLPRYIHPYPLQKVGGILTETKLQGEIVKQLVIGIGINTNNEEISTSIKKEYVSQEIELTLYKQADNWVVEDSEAFFKAIMGYQSDQITFEHLSREVQ